MDMLPGNTGKGSRRTHSSRQRHMGSNHISSQFSRLRERMVSHPIPIHRSQHHLMGSRNTSSHRNPARAHMGSRHIPIHSSPVQAHMDNRLISIHSDKC
jgi:hypothetical protein